MTTLDNWSFKSVYGSIYGNYIEVADTSVPRSFNWNGGADSTDAFTLGDTTVTIDSVEYDLGTVDADYLAWCIWGFGKPAAGCILPFVGTSVPNGYTLCDGSALYRITNPGLFAVCGTTYGSGNGTTTFNIPDLRGKVVLGTSGSYSQGSSGGSATHNHDAHSYTPAGTISSHGTVSNISLLGLGSAASTDGHTFTGTNTNLTHSTVNHLPPYVVTNYIIKL